MATEKEMISPIEVSRALNSIPCSLSIRREDPICIFDYIAEARNYVVSLWNLGINIGSNLCSVFY